MQMQENKYSYSTQPHSAPMKNKKKYREDEPPGSPNEMQNIMFDNRVIRGNTYAAKVMSTSLKTELELNNKVKTKPNKRSNPGTSRKSGMSTPPPVNGRNHMFMQTDDYLEEITDRPIEQDAETQTLPFLDRPPSPLFVRSKIGFDIATQIENGDLFDFDLEVEPILEVLVGKTIHVSMLELMQEEELDAIRLQQEEFETIRNLELAEVQRLEAEIKRKTLEKERRIAQEKKRLEDRRKLEETIAARAFADQFLNELHVSVFDMLEEQGEFYDPVKKEIEEFFMGGLIKNVVVRADCYEAASQIALELIEEARKKAKIFEAQEISLRKALLEKLAQEAATKKLEEEAELARLAAEAAALAAVEEVETDA